MGKSKQSKDKRIRDTKDYYVTLVIDTPIQQAPVSAGLGPRFRIENGKVIYTPPKKEEGAS